MSARRVKSAVDSIQTAVGRFLQRVLPDADDFPSLPAQLAIYAPVAGHVVCSLVDALAAGK